MSEVIQGSANPRVGEEAEHEQVRSEKENREEQPTEMEVRVEEDGGEEQASFLDAEQPGGTREHSRSISLSRCRLNR